MQEEEEPSGATERVIPCHLEMMMMKERERHSFFSLSILNRNEFKEKDTSKTVTILIFFCEKSEEEIVFDLLSSRVSQPPPSFYPSHNLQYIYL